ncbi:lachesin-like [Bacillus rossius redtenbacheri]|uniref:lachesin-like n=1 Tax=Bacillus rossius redtenbacheri TaxID=93214 RepID=UPI002FDDCE39
MSRGRCASLLLLLLLLLAAGCRGAGPQDAVVDLKSAAPGQPYLSAAGGDPPDFSQPIRNVTVPLGREAVLTCSVAHLGNYKVGWLKAEDQTILTLHNKVVTHNSRVSVSRDGDHTWRLHLRQVKEADRGCYMCQINTSVMKKQVGCVDVHVPPGIVDAESSSDATLREGDNATLRCRAEGRPPPRIMWRREDGELLTLRKGPRDVAKVDMFSGDTLFLMKIDRTQMGAYMCIASNDIPPAVSKRISLHINFPPVVKVPNQLLGAPFGTDVQLECHVEAFPNTINYWLKNRQEMLLSEKKHMIEEIRSSYKVHMKLIIKALGKSDLGTYTCVSTNSLGHADGTIRLYEIKVSTRMPIIPHTKQAITTPGFTVPNRSYTSFEFNSFVTTTNDPRRAAATTTEGSPEQNHLLPEFSYEVAADVASGAACRTLAGLFVPLLLLLS